MQGAEVKCDDIARLHVERHDLVLIAHRIDVGNELEVACTVDVGGVVDELARHESATPQV